MAPKFPPRHILDDPDYDYTQLPDTFVEEDPQQQATYNRVRGTAQRPPMVQANRRAQTGLRPQPRAQIQEDNDDDAQYPRDYPAFEERPPVARAAPRAPLPAFRPVVANDDDDDDDESTMDPLQDLPQPQVAPQVAPPRARDRARLAQARALRRRLEPLPAHLQRTGAAANRRSTSWSVVIHIDEENGQLPEDYDVPPRNGLPAGVRYIAGQLERGGRQDGLHWQLYVVMNQAGTPSQMAHAMGWTDPSLFAHMYIEPVWSNHDAMLDYVTTQNKPGITYPDTTFVMGERPQGNVVAQASAVYADIRDGKPLTQIAREHTGAMVRNFSNVVRVHALLNPPPERPDIINIIFWGPTGTGKSHRARQWARELCPEQEPYIKMTGRDEIKWWDGYTDQEVVIWEEFTGEPTGLLINQLLQITDKYPLQVQIKGGTVALAQKINIFTTNVPLDEWYPHARESQKAALQRRFKPENIFYLGERYEGPQ